MDQHGDYVERAKARILELLQQEHAMTVFETEARLGEVGHARSGLNIDPHHITTALRQLAEENHIVRVTEATRGGGDITTIQPADQHKRTTAIAQAAGRKRLLYARYLSWAQSSSRHPSGRVGPAGEEAVRLALRNSGALQPAVPDFRETSTVLGVNLPGPVDSAGYMVPFVNGLPGPVTTILVEVKNIRSWIYPAAEELYQLLSKATLLQQAHPAQPIVPVFVCRKAHETTFWMARQLGFMVIDMGAQFVGDVEQDKLDEVRRGLYFLDLQNGTGPSLRVRDRFRDTLPNHCSKIAERWRDTALNTTLAPRIMQLKTATAKDRSSHMEWFRYEVKAAGLQGGW